MLISVAGDVLLEIFGGETNGFRSISITERGWNWTGCKFGMFTQIQFSGWHAWCKRRCERQLKLEWDVLGLSSWSYLPFRQPVVHHITWRERKGKIYRASVQSVLTYGTETKHGWCPRETWMMPQGHCSSRVHTVDIDPLWHNMDCCI